MKYRVTGEKLHSSGSIEKTTCVFPHYQFTMAQEMMSRLIIDEQYLRVQIEVLDNEV